MKLVQEANEVSLGAHGEALEAREKAATEATQRGVAAETELRAARSTAAEQANTFAEQLSALQARLSLPTPSLP